MCKLIYHLVALAVFSVLSFSCSSQPQPVEQREESREAKQLLQGVWMDEDMETAVFQMKGDTVYYADSTSMPAYFRVIGDTLYIGTSGRYFIEKQTEHLLCFKMPSGETARYVKSDDKELGRVFEQTKPQILELTEVLKRDTVVFFEGERYHLYIAVNPTKYKVSRQSVNDDGLTVENAYYDNIIHLSIFKGAAQIFSRDFHKKAYERLVPAQFMQHAILNNMEFNQVDAQGFHFNASLCVPEDASCYLVDQVVSFKGKPSAQLLEY